MKEQFVTYEIALKLKELGFDEPCLGAYSEDKNWKLIYIDENNGYLFMNSSMSDAVSGFLSAPLWQQAIDWCDSKGLLVGTIVVDNLYKSTINKINYETELFHSRNESIKRAIEFAISYLQDNK